LLDRFGLFTEVETVLDLNMRVEIVERRERFERAASEFTDEYKRQQEALKQRISRARRLLDRVEIGRDMLRLIAELCIRLKVDGHRGELTMARAARALAALGGRRVVSLDDARQVATMALRHRLRKDPLERLGSGLQIEQALESLFGSRFQGRLEATG
jgi:magnesium chelatase subunit I